MLEKCSNLVDMTYSSANNFPDKVFLKYKPEDSGFTSITFRQYLKMTVDLSGALYELGLRKGDKAAIISDNMYKWLIADMAILSLGATDVPRGSDSNLREIEYILKHSGSKLCFVEDKTQLERIISIIPELPLLKTIIVLQGAYDENGEYPVNVTNFDKLMKDGENLAEKHKEALSILRMSIRKEDTATIIYTSGTTGVPKGVMLSHDNLVCNVRFMMQILPVSDKDRWVSVLPVWHVYERTVEYAILGTAGLMAYSKPAAKYLLPVMAEIKPTFMVSVPRIWESVYSGVMTQLKTFSPLKKNIFETFLHIGLMHNKNWKRLSGMETLFQVESKLKKILKFIGSIFIFALLFLPDTLGFIIVFSKLRRKLGGKLTYPISGGGKLPDYIDDFFSALKINILEGYGMTETSPVICVRTPKTLVSKTVGRPLPYTEVMIGDENFIPLSDQTKKGIIYVKGRIVMQGYYKDVENTSKVLRNGWLNTGDLGRKTVTGEVQILGRAKETIVLTGGENIEPQPIEEKIKESEIIRHIMLVGQDEKYLGALIVPEESAAIEWAAANKIKHENYSELCRNHHLEKHILSIIRDKINTKNGFKSVENIKYIKLIDKDFTVGDELTMSLKMKRNHITEKYESLIKEMYK